MIISEKVLHLSKTCGKSNILLKSASGGAVKYALFKIRCKSWLCPKCARRLARSWSISVKRYFAGSHIRVVTLTIPHTVSVDRSYKHAAVAWNRLRVSLTRYLKQKIKFVRVLEPQSSGHAHYHILIDHYIPHAVLKALAVQSGFGSICFIQDVKSEQIFDYVSKYLRKKWTSEKGLQASIDAHSRRCSGSQGFVLLRYSSGSWKLLQRDIGWKKGLILINAIRSQATMCGWQIQDETMSAERWLLSLSDVNPGTAKSAVWNDFAIPKLIEFLLWQPVEE
jgi:hypothetical protein